MFEKVKPMSMVYGVRKCLVPQSFIREVEINYETGVCVLKYMEMQAQCSPPWQTWT